MEEYQKELKIGSADDMLANAEKINEKTLTLKSLEKRVNELEKEINYKLEVLERRIDTIKKSLTR
jgi:hypothetical protein